MTLAAVVLTREAVAKLMEDFDDRHRDTKINPVMWPEKLVKRWQPRPKHVELDQQQRECAQPQHRKDHD